MYKLKLTKARSYNNGIVKATKEKPYIEVEDVIDAQKLINTGYFKLEETVNTAEDTAEDDATETISYEELSAMKKAELEAYATVHGINISACKTKADILAVISEADGGEAEMIDLQEE